ncbi:aminofutalosine synthase MqnE [Syntrophotalea acetylenivorans]|uniref:Aminodeoxyfutalosine synthase n=1 Tax=Syntrophotalea acetylenivorans TaxID=1842532 RepID=A0A1L3GRC3_9BACT|nr:aminofutalosine synthase MqnE [Syntrophotalea acetylenivorans]APG28484.1 aminofutalosine synthase MqnE [Syntrophotalea acetylenivorans]
MKKLFAPIAAKIEGGKRISGDEALQLAACDDLLALGTLAARVNKGRNGARVFFNRNRHINYSNICISSCAFCAFRRDARQQGAFCLSPQEVGERAAGAAADGAREVHVVGGLHPGQPFSYYLQMLQAIRRAAPEIHIKAFTAVEIDHLSRLTGWSLDKVLAELRAAGLDSLPGGGAEIFASAVREQLCPEKISGQRWLDVMTSVHGAGLRSNATMLFGHLESWRDRIDHLLQLRELQDRTGGFMAFIPLPYQADNTRLPELRGPGGVEILKTLAISRLVLDNFDHIKGYWVMLGVKLAQVALAFGVNDLDGTVIEERIGHAAGAASPQALSCDDLLWLIRRAGKLPVERDSLYSTVREYGPC